MSKSEKTLYTTTPENSQEIADSIAQDIEDGRLQHALDRFPQFGTTGSLPDAHLRAKMLLTRCPKCGQSAVRLSVEERKGELWDSLDDYSVENTTDEKLIHR